MKGTREEAESTIPSLCITFWEKCEVKMYDQQWHTISFAVHGNMFLYNSVTTSEVCNLSFPLTDYRHTTKTETAWTYKKDLYKSITMQCMKPPIPWATWILVRMTSFSSEATLQCQSTSGGIAFEVLQWEGMGQKKTWIRSNWSGSCTEKHVSTTVCILFQATPCSRPLFAKVHDSNQNWWLNG